MLEQVNYSALDSQKKSHKAFVDKMLELKRDADKGMAIFAVPKVSRLGVDWLKDHILVMDNKYAEACNTGGFR